MMEFVSNDMYEQKEANESKEKTLNPAKDNGDASESKKKYFAFWNVDGRSYKLKLKTSKIQDLEKMYKCNLMSLMGDADRMPTLTTMLQITHAAMEPWEHGIKLKHVEELYENYINTGGSMLQFYVEIYMNIFAVSGFFSQSMAEDVTDSMERMSESM